VVEGGFRRAITRKKRSRRPGKDQRGLGPEEGNEVAKR
jgi:hypothetical protein